MKHKLRASFLFAVSVFQLPAQVATGNIRGTVLDGTGAVLPNCPIAITNTSNGTQRSVTTNERGDFNVPSLPIGFYDVTAALTGFQKTTISGIELRVDQTVSLTLELKPGAVTESVEVNASAPLLESRSPRSDRLWRISRFWTCL